MSVTFVVQVKTAFFNKLQRIDQICKMALTQLFLFVIQPHELDRLDAHTETMGKFDAIPGVTFQSKPSLVLPPNLPCPLLNHNLMNFYWRQDQPTLFACSSAPRQLRRTSGIDLTAPLSSPLETSLFLVESAREGYE